MPRQSGTSVENNFTKGLITETTALKFPPNACTEIFDCVIDSIGSVTRRLAFDYEDNFVLIDTTPETNEVFTEFLWNAVAGDGSLGFVVQQQGSTIRFFDVSTSTDVSANLKTFTIDLNNYVVTNSNADPAVIQCNYAQGNGDLLIANSAIDPIYVSYDSEADDITVTEILIQYRDFEGLEDGLDLTERPTSTLAALILANPEHYYNLINQGWYVGYSDGGSPALDQWDTARTDLPSNADMVSYYRASETDSFDNAKVIAKEPGSSPATKGHFILTAPLEDRQAAAAAEGFTVVLPGTTALISGGTGTNIGDMTANGGLAAAFDGDTTESSGACAGKGGNTDTGYVGKNYTASPNQVASCIVYGSNNIGFVDTGADAITITLYGKNGSVPANASDGTSLGTVGFNNSADESAGRSITSSDPNTFWDYIWVKIDDTTQLTSFFCAELNIFTAFPGSFERPSAVEFYAGRAFWAGIAKDTFSNLVYFSQIIENRDQYGKCYQQNDPTSEQLAELLPSDGGVVKIPELGTVQRLFATRNAIIIFANNGIWLISGTTGSPFKATEYQVKRITSIGMTSPLSVIDVNGLPLWWGEDGIYTMEFDANYDSFKLVSTTVQSIDTFFNAIPATNRQYAKGATDVLNKVAYWIYNSDLTLANTDFYKYDSVLVFDAVAQAFYPWTIGDGTPDIRGILYTLASSRSAAGVVKYTTTVDDDLTYSEANNPSYLDWEEAGDDVDYTSYFITGYKLDGQTQRFFQSNYVFVFLETEDGASCLMQGVFDFTNSPNSGKWSTQQQIYNSALTLRDVNFRRLKIRGKGRSLQLRFESTTGDPFTIIGWSIWETSNASL